MEDVILMQHVQIQLEAIIANVKMDFQEMDLIVLVWQLHFFKEKKN